MRGDTRSCFSTRGAVQELSFGDAVIYGLAEDGGLFVPSFLPRVEIKNQNAWRALEYKELCFTIMRLFIHANEIPDADLRTIIHQAYGTFRQDSCVTVTRVAASELLYLMELFHGPTFAFKDFALQFLGRLLNFLRRDANDNVTVLGATSGDTGSAAIEGFRGIPKVNCAILFPKGRTSRIQELQMITALESNVYCVALQDGTFDDCQDIVKGILNSSAKERLNLTTANSINWARILAQMVYYWFSAFRVQELHGSQDAVDVCVPTGNFGNILAAYYARSMGAPLRRLIIASNTNDILTRFSETGHYELRPVTPTISPSMDIQISSNFERLLYDLCGRDPSYIQQKFERDLLQHRNFTVEPELLAKFHQCFSAYSASEDATAATIQRIYRSSLDHGSPQILDPHTAVGVYCAECYADARCRRCRPKGLEDGNTRLDTTPVLVAATAHFGKFYDVLTRILGHAALCKMMPTELSDLHKREQRVDVCVETSIDAVL